MKKFLIDCFIATAFVFIVLLSLKGISKLALFNAFDPLGQSLGDMELTDITFSRLRNDPPIDTNIVMVNIGTLSRAQIGDQIRIISRYKPKVIGMDSFFICNGGYYDIQNCPQAYDTLSNMILGTAIEDAGNVVLVSKLMQTKKLIKEFGDVFVYDSIQHTDSLIRGKAMEGYANLDTGADHQEDLKSCRVVNPSIKVNDKDLLAFSVKVAMEYDSVKTKKFLARRNVSEVINYRGNIYDPFGASEYPSRYYTLDVQQVFDTTSFSPTLFKDKVVIMGFLGNTLDDTSWDDKFFTPLNKNYAGKSRPDMYGAVVHANVVSMILSEDYVNQLSDWQQNAIAVIVCFLNVMLFSVITKRFGVWFDSLSLLLQVIQLVIITMIMIFFFSWFSFKLNLTATLAALALVGTCFELYNDVVKAFLAYLKRKLRLTNKSDEVLTP